MTKNSNSCLYIYEFKIIAAIMNCKEVKKLLFNGWLILQREQNASAGGGKLFIFKTPHPFFFLRSLKLSEIQIKYMQLRIQGCMHKGCNCFKSSRNRDKELKLFFRVASWNTLTVFKLFYNAIRKRYFYRCLYLEIG